MKKTTSNAITLCVCYFFLIVGGFIVIYPLIFMFMAGFFTAQEYNKAVIGLFPIPKMPTLKNYLAVFNVSEFSMLQTYFMNSLFRTAVCTASALVTTLICGYVFARLRFKGKRAIFLALLFTTMIPGTVSLIPTYLMYARWPFAGGNRVFTGGTGILDTWAVYLIGCPSINIMGTFFVKQYIESIPGSLDESAKIDGANVFRVLFQVLLPLAKPAVAYIAITTAIGVWNDWSTGFFFTSSDKLQLLPSAISKLNAQGVGSVPDYPMMLTLGLASTIPALVIYFIFQKSIIECVATAGLKG